MEVWARYELDIKSLVMEIILHEHPDFFLQFIQNMRFKKMANVQIS